MHTVHAVLSSGDRLFDHWNREFAANRPVQLREVRLPDTKKSNPAVSAPRHPEVSTNEIRSLNQTIRRLNVHLKNDQSYLVKTELLKSLRALGKELKKATTSRIGPTNLTEANQELECLLARIGKKGWASAPVASSEMRDVLLNLDNATAALKQ